MGDSSIQVIFGASGGIGSALARHLARTGFRPVLLARNPGRLEALTEELHAPHYTVDACQGTEVLEVFQQIVREQGPIAGVAHCVGSILLKPAHLTSETEWAGTLATNLTSAFHVVQAAGRHLAATGGSVVLVSSVAAQRGLANHEAIAAAKAGVEGLVRSAAATYARQRIRFNAVAPGLVRTPLSASLTATEASLRHSTALHPLGRIGEPEDIASAIAWLLSPDQSWITGQIIAVDGGLGAVQPR